MTKTEKPNIAIDQPAEPLQAQGPPYAPPHETPFVFFDGVSCFGIVDGVAQLTVEAQRLRCEDGRTAITERVMNAHLRCTLSALAQLRASIDGVFKLAEQQAAAASANAAAEARRLN